MYDGSRQAPQGLPRGLEQLGDERYRGRFGIAPATAAFAEHMAVYRVLEGPEALDSLLARIRDNLPQTFPDDGAVVRAVAQGQVDFGVVNHQHVLRADEAERGRLRTVFMTEGQASAFVTPAGIGVLSDDPRALDLVRFLLGAESQRYMAAATREYPLASDAPPAPGLPPLSSLRTPAVDFADVAAVLRETETAMRRAGLLR